MKIIKAFCAGLLVLVVIYLFGAFTLWELNPALWTAHERSGVIVFGFPLAIVAGLFTGFGNAR